MLCLQQWNNRSHRCSPYISTWEPWLIIRKMAFIKYYFKNLNFNFHHLTESSFFRPHYWTCAICIFSKSGAFQMKIKFFCWFTESKHDHALRSNTWMLDFIMCTKITKHLVDPRIVVKCMFPSWDYYFLNIKNFMTRHLLCDSSRSNLQQQQHPSKLIFINNSALTSTLPSFRNNK